MSADIPHRFADSRRRGHRRRPLGALRRREGGGAACRHPAAAVGGTPAARSCAAVAVNTRPGTQAEALAQAAGLPVLHDAPGDAAGPLSGVKAGLVWARETRRDRAGGQSLRRAVAAGRPVHAAECGRGARGRGHGRDRRRRAATVRGLAGERARGSSSARSREVRIRRPGACSRASVRSASTSRTQRRSPISTPARIWPPSRNGSGAARDGLLPAIELRDEPLREGLRPAAAARRSPPYRSAPGSRRARWVRAGPQHAGRARRA